MLSTPYLWKTIQMRRTVRSIRVLVIGCGVCAFCVAGWWLWRHYIPQAHPTLSPAIPLTQQLPTLDIIGLTELEEVTSLTATMTSGPVVALVLPAGKDELLAAYSGDNYIRNWNLSNHVLAAEFAVGLVGEKGTGFDSKGTLIVSALCVREIATGVHIWPARSCSVVQNAQNEIVIYPGGNWLLGYTRGSHFLGIQCVEMHCNADLTTYSLGDVDDPEGLLTIDKVVFDSTGSLAAVTFEQGNIRIYGLTGEANLDLNYRVELGERNIRENVPTQALIFDDTRSWLAMLRGEQLWVWDLRLGRNQLHFSASVPTGKLLTFDRMGKFLLVGTADAIQVWDVASKKLLKEYVISGISALTTSPDGRLVIWGDSQGIIHLWGAPKP